MGVIGIEPPWASGWLHRFDVRSACPTAKTAADAARRDQARRRTVPKRELNHPKVLTAATTALARPSRWMSSRNALCSARTISVARACVEDRCRKACRAILVRIVGERHGCTLEAASKILRRNRLAASESSCDNPRRSSNRIGADPRQNCARTTPGWPAIAAGPFQGTG